MLFILFNVLQSITLSLNYFFFYLMYSDVDIFWNKEHSKRYNYRTPDNELKILYSFRYFEKMVYLLYLSNKKYLINCLLIYKCMNFNRLIIINF